MTSMLNKDEEFKEEMPVRLYEEEAKSEYVRRSKRVAKQNDPDAKSQVGEEF